MNEKRTAVLSVCCSSDAYCGGDFALVALDAERIEIMLQRIDLVRQLYQQDSTVHQLVLWNDWPGFVGWGELDELGYGALTEAVADRERVFVDGPLTIPQDELATVDDVRMVVTRNKVYWRACVKHTAIVLETAALPKETLRTALPGTSATAASDPRNDPSLLGEDPKMQGRVFFVQCVSFHEDDGAFDNRALLVIPNGEAEWPYIKRKAAAILHFGHTHIDDEGNVFDGDCQSGTVHYHEVTIDGWTITAHREEAAGPPVFGEEGCA